MHHSHLSCVARRLLGALFLTLLLLVPACDAPAARTIGGYCRRDTDCVSGLRCLNLACTERRQGDAGAPRDMGGIADTGVDTGPEDMGVDVGPEDTGVDLGPEDMGPEDMGPEDMGMDAGS